MTFNLLGHPYHINGITLIHFIPELVNVPVNSQQTIVDDPDIGPHTFNFLCIPQRIGIIITESKKDRILRAAFKIVPGNITRQMFFASVVIIPFLLGHDDRRNDTNHRCCNIDAHGILAA